MMHWIGGKFINISHGNGIMKRSYADGMQGAAFGVIEATIMMIGVMIGLSITGDRRVLMLGVVAAGIADAVANGAAFYISEEAEGIHTRKGVKHAAYMTFLGTLIAVALVVSPLLYLSLKWGMILSAVVAVILISSVGSYVARHSMKKKSTVILQYLLIAFAAAVVCFLAGELVKYIESTI
jgi:VIT1/CCC1 family predicted Fe2+/Mn2+ transporter